MPDLLVRNLAPTTMVRLKHRARHHGRSLQAEAKLVLEHAAGRAAVEELLDAWQTRLAGRRFSRSADLIREDRER